MAGLLILAMAACVGPAEGYTKASRGIYDQIAPAHEAYLEADATLSTAQKARRIRVLEAWDLMLRKAEGVK